MAARKLVNLLRGSVTLAVSGAFPERFLNLCAQRGAAFWGVAWRSDHDLRLTVAWADRQGLEDLAQRAGCTLTEERKGGLPPFLLRFRTRYALLAGLALSLAAVCVLSRFVLVIDVEGNGTVPAQVILAELRRQGLRPGVYGPGLPARDIANRALLRLDGLSWMTVNLHGIRAQVVVREKVAKPELLDESILGDIIAEAPGLITGMEVWSGDPAVAEGATVLPGDVLIRGSVRMDPPPYSEDPPEWMPVRAMGKVEGRTWRTLEGAVPLTAEVKRYTGEEKPSISLLIFGQSVNFRGKYGIPYERYDKINRTWNLTLPGGETLPFALRWETCRAYETVPLPVDEAAAQAMVEERLAARLLTQLGETGEVVDQRFTARVAGGVLRVTLVAECREELGRFVPAQREG